MTEDDWEQIQKDLKATKKHLDNANRNFDIATALIVIVIVLNALKLFGIYL